MPFVSVADLVGMYAGFDLIEAMAADGSARVVSGHDPSTLDRFGRGGPLGDATAVIGGGRR